VFVQSFSEEVQILKDMKYLLRIHADGVKHKRVVWLDWNGTLNVESCDFRAILIIVKVVTFVLI
jgi:hypothetical protein